jgi:WD40 repeat protein
MTQKRGRGGKMIRKGHKKRVWAVATSPDGTRLASVDMGGVLCVGGLWQSPPEHVIQAHPSYATGVCWLDDVRVVAAGVDGAGVWEAETGAKVDEVTYPERTVVQNAVVWGDRVVLSGQSSPGWLWSPGGGIERWSSRPGSRLASTPDGLLAYHDEGGDVVVVDVSGDEVWRAGAGGFVHGLALSPDGSCVAVGVWVKQGLEAGYHVRLHDLPSGALRHVHGGFGSSLDSMVFSEDGVLLAIGPGSEVLGVARVDDGERVSDAISGLTVAKGAAMADGTLVIAESMEAKVRLYDLRRFLA